MSRYSYISENEFDTACGAIIQPNGELFLYKDVAKYPINLVWTVYEDGSIDEDGYSDNNWYARPGVIPSIALGYLITTKPWDEHTRDAILYLDDDELARKERRSFNLA